MNGSTAKTADEKSVEEWDTIRKDFPVILVDEAYEAGIGKERGGKASDTFTIVAMVSKNPGELLRIYESVQSRSEDGLEGTELKYSKGGENVGSIVGDLLGTDTAFFAGTVMKRDPDIPSEYSPASAVRAHRSVTKDVLLAAMAQTEGDAVNVYFDTHSAFKRKMAERIAREAAEETGKRIGEARMLGSRNEPLLQICDYPVGVVGEYMEIPIPRSEVVDLYGRISRRLHHTVIGKTSKAVSKNSDAWKGDEAAGMPSF